MNNLAKSRKSRNAENGDSRPRVPRLEISEKTCKGIKKHLNETNISTKRQKK